MLLDQPRRLKATVAATTYVELLSMSTGVTGPAIKSMGETNVNLRLIPNGTGQLDVTPGTAGTAARPDIVLGGDVDSGLFMSAANKLGISTGGTVRAEFSVTGIKVGGTADHAGTAGTGVISIFNATAPVGALTNGASLYTATGEMYTIDAAGNVTLQSPHSPDGDLIAFHYNATADRTRRIHLEKLLMELVRRDPSLARFVEDYDGKHHNGEV